MELEGDITALQPTAVCSYWKEFDLESLRGSLDEQGLKVAENQEGSVKTRKALAERTKGRMRNSRFYQQFMKFVGPSSQPSPPLSNKTCSSAEFKRTVAPEVMKAVAALLKSYQEEVDRLTSR